jgi:hypothetical protein
MAGAVTQLPTAKASPATTWRRVGMIAFPVRILLEFISGSQIDIRRLLHKNMSSKYVQDNSLLSVECFAETIIQTSRGKTMSYPAGHRPRTKGKIIESARRLFNRHGFDNVSVKQIMSGAGLTHGAFYSYFRSKSDLYTEVLTCFFTDPHWKNCWEGVHVDLSSTDVGPQLSARIYLLNISKILRIPAR